MCGLKFDFFHVNIFEMSSTSSFLHGIITGIGIGIAAGVGIMYAAISHESRKKSAEREDVCADCDSVKWEELNRRVTTLFPINEEDERGEYDTHINEHNEPLSQPMTPILQDTRESIEPQLTTEYEVVQPSSVGDIVTAYNDTEFDKIRKSNAILLAQKSRRFARTLNPPSDSV